jgi:hypothetical protein
MVESKTIYGAIHLCEFPVVVDLPNNRADCRYGCVAEDNYI